MKWFLPFFALVAFAGLLGWRMGQVPTETEIINRYAASYLGTAPEGAKPTDCAAATHPSDLVRMVVTCTHHSGLLTTFFVGPRGRTVDPASLRQPGA